MSEEVEHPPAKRARLENHCNSHGLKKAENQVSIWGNVGYYVCVCVCVCVCVACVRTCIRNLGTCTSPCGLGGHIYMPLIFHHRPRLQ